MFEALHDLPVRGAGAEDGTHEAMLAASTVTLGTSIDAPSSTPVAVPEPASAFDGKHLRQVLISGESRPL